MVFVVNENQLIMRTSEMESESSMKSCLIELERQVFVLPVF